METRPSKVPGGVKRTSKIRRRVKAASSERIDSLILGLDQEDGLARADAREALVAIGEPAVDALVGVLASPKIHVRWEAARALAEIADSRAAPALVHVLLTEPAFDVRWLAAEGLAAIGDGGLEPLLQALEDHSDSVWLRQGALVVLAALSKRGWREELRGVVAALMDVEPTLEVPLAARVALDNLTAE